MQTLPNILSSIRIVLALVFIVMFLQPSVFWRTLSVAVFATAAVTDFFDGYIARNFQAESSSGVFLDPLADKILTFAGFFCLPFINPQFFPWWGVILIVIRDSGVTGLRMWAELKGIKMQTRNTAKIKTFVQMLFLYGILLLYVFAAAGLDSSAKLQTILDMPMLHWLFQGVIWLTVYTGLEYIWFNKALLKPRR